MRILVAGFYLLSLVILLASCERSTIKQAREAMRLTEPPAPLNDDLSLEQLHKAIEDNIKRLKQIKTASLTFGPRVVSKEDYIMSLDYLAEQIKSETSETDFFKTVVKNFDFYEVYGKDKWGEVLITSYYNPVIPGSREKTSRYSQALFSVPYDLVTIRLDRFVESFDNLSPIKDQVLEQKSQIGILRGRLIPPATEGASSTIVPYYSREEIENKQILNGQDLELAWVDPVEAFFLHVQGSGTVRFEDGEELRIGYASKNGHPFVAISKFVLDAIPRGKMSMQAIANYLRELPEEEMRKILNKNPSYIFFRKLKGKPITSLGTEVVAGRTIATDKSFFPKGALAYMEFEKPVFTDRHSIQPVRWEPTSRFVLDQDTGGAIRSPHRVDLYWGKGREAGQHAGVMKNWGRLYYLVPRDEFLQELLGDPDSLR